LDFHHFSDSSKYAFFSAAIQNLAKNIGNKCLPQETTTETKKYKLPIATRTDPNRFLIKPSRML
jgi:hypothetical protein